MKPLKPHLHLSRKNEHYEVSVYLYLTDHRVKEVENKLEIPEDYPEDHPKHGKRKRRRVNIIIESDKYGMLYHFRESYQGHPQGEHDVYITVNGVPEEGAQKTMTDPPMGEGTGKEEEADEN
jgi:hypothetical protein